MSKKDKTKIFIEEINSKPPKEKHKTIKKVYKHVDQIWTIALLDLNDYKTLNKRAYRFFLKVIDDIFEFGWTTPLKNQNSQPISDEFFRCSIYFKKKTH